MHVHPDIAENAERVVSGEYARQHLPRMQHRVTCIYMYPSVNINIIHHSASKHRKLGKATGPTRQSMAQEKEKKFSPSRKWSRHPYPGISSSGPTRTVAPRALAMAMLSRIRSIFPYSTPTQIRACMPAQKAMQSVSQSVSTC